jgi:hypothetical protein
MTVAHHVQITLDLRVEAGDPDAAITKARKWAELHDLETFVTAVTVVPEPAETGD